MAYSDKIVKDTREASSTLADRSSREAVLIEDLMSPDLDRRLGAQHELITRGGTAVPALLEALQHENPHVRNAAAHVLAVIAEPASAAALAAALDDVEAPVRWVAAEGLVAMGRTGLRAALRALVSADVISPHLVAAVRHILLKLRSEGGLGEIATPVLIAMEKSQLYEGVSNAARGAVTALDGLE
jgi:hypothetical protein